LSNLAIRILVAVVGIPLILLLILAGGFYFFAFIAVVSAAGLHEYYNLARSRGMKPQVVMGIAFGFCLNGVFLYDKLRYLIVGWLVGHGIGAPFPSMEQLFLIVLLFFVPLVFLVELFRNHGSALANIAVTVTGALYLAMSLGSLVGTRELFVPGDFPFYSYFNLVGSVIPDEIVSRVYRWGALTVITVFASIWMCDSMAYFVGRRYGKHKLFERVSPNKTWEGAVAGFIGAVAMFLVGESLTLPYLSFADALVCGCLVGVFGQLGDMVESLLKRDAGVKDSSSLIPGHGGALDRFDSLIFVSPLIFLYLDFIVF
jgi:phosphatidate cytidylyltransferase